MNTKLLIVAVVLLVVLFKDELLGGMRAPARGRAVEPGPPPSPDYSAVSPERPPNAADVAIHLIDQFGRAYEARYGGGRIEAAPATVSRV